MAASGRKAFALVVASTDRGGIGLRGGLPWSLPGDLKRFRELTAGGVAAGKRNAVIMGRKTFFSIPDKFRPLGKRLNVVLSRRGGTSEDKENGAGEFPEGVVVVPRLMDAIDHVSQDESVERVFVIGGASVYEEAMKLEQCQTVFRTRVLRKDGAEIEADTFMPALSEALFAQTAASLEAPVLDAEGGLQYQFQEYARRAPRHEEMQYLDMVREILETGNDKGDRTGTGTLSLFGKTMRYSLRDGTFPLLTSKRVFWRGVAEELLWFISGKTSAKLLQDKNIKIWDGNSSREYLDKIGLTEREEGDLGPVYGFQWRHFGAEYTTMHEDYTGKGVDQLAKIIDTLRKNPNDRRLVMSAWNPKDMPYMALPPCHLLCQFYVARGELSCMMYQRSCDMGLGVPFNIASYALLTCMIAKVAGLVPGDFVHVLGDAHVYKNHVEPLREQLNNTPRPFPKLIIHGDQKDIDSFKFEDFELVGYDPHKTIAMKMAV